VFSTDVRNAHNAEYRIVSNRADGEPRQTPNGSAYTIQSTTASATVPTRYQGLKD